MTDQIGLIGTGLLREAIAGVLGDRAVTVHSVAEEPDPPVAMLILASDAWDLSGHDATRTRAAAAGIPWLPVRTELGQAVVGPLETPGAPGCVECVKLRRRRLRPDRADRAAVRRQHRAQLATRPSSWLTGLAADLVAELVAEEVDRVGAGELTRTHRALYRVDLAELGVRQHTFLPDPACPVCGDLPDDSAEQARLRLQPRPAHTPGSYRTRSLRGELPRLVDTYVDSETGLIRSLTGWDAGAQVYASAPVGWRNTGGKAVGYGGAATFTESRLTALLEGLERYASAPGGRRTVVQGSYHQLQADALDPRTLGLHAPEQYDQPGFLFEPYDPDRRYRWVWGWSFARAAPILVPEQCAYYSVPYRHEDGHGFLYEISNGCALGGSLEEAILYGILEVVERDAFLLTWYAQLPVPRIDLASAQGRAVRLLAASIEAETGYQVSAFDVSTELGVPCVWAMARHPSAAPAAACAAGAHPDPETAVRSALRELGTGVAGLIRRCQDPANVNRARELAADSHLVREMEDHPLLYADPGAAQRLDFLSSPREVRPVAAMGGAAPGGFASDDLRDNVEEAVRRCTSQGLDVVVVDQTADEHRAGGFACVKVLVPGSLSMTFGHQYRRVVDLPRLYQAPVRLGYRDRPLRPDEVNQFPHPFP